MTQHQVQVTATALTGALSGTGQDMLRATVHTGAVPSHPPGELADLVQPVYDSRGQLRDWRIGASRSGQRVDDIAFARYRHWRSQFAEDRVLGERALIRAFLEWAGTRCETSALAILRAPAGRVDFHAALMMKMQIEGCRRVVAATAEDGIGLYPGGSTRGALRAFIPMDPPALLLGLGRSALTAGPDGLCLRSPEAEGGVRAVTGWRVARLGVAAAVQDGEVDLAGDAATLLRVAGRQSPVVEVHPAALSILLAPLLVFLRDAAALAGDTASDLQLHSAWT
jgi:hypothetical protein